MKYMYLASAIIFFCTSVSQAQCPTGEVEISIEVLTDDYGYESYWQLLPSGNSCGNSPVFAGGNANVGCNGGGLQAQDMSGYGNNIAITEGPWCLTEGVSYDIYSVDDWADGGTEFNVLIEGLNMHQFISQNTDETFTFTAQQPPAIDGAMRSIDVPAYVDREDIIIKGTIENTGINPITSFTISYSINSGAEINDNITGVNILSLEEYDFSHNIPWQPLTTGTFNLMASISNINGGGADGSPANDAINKNIFVREPTPNIIASYHLEGNTFDYQMIGDAADQLNTPRDLDFHPNGMELWVVNEETAAVGGGVVTYTNPGQANQTSIYRKDGNARHFMSLPSGIAFSDNGNFATSTSVLDANFNPAPGEFTGPTLWSSDPLIFAQPSGGNGSHLDMLHESPHCMGIASERDNVFWVTDAMTNDIVRYDYVDDHGPGNDYHADAIVRRYPEISFNWVSQDVSSHLVLDKAKKWMYIVDGGGQRILRLDITTGAVDGTTPAYAAPEPLTEYSNVSGTTWEVMVSSGLSQPSGIALIDNDLIVSDHSNGDLIFYDISTTPATEIKRLNTGSAGIQGIVIGPQGRLWFVNSANDEIYRIEPDSIIVPQTPTGIAGVAAPEIDVYPNPATSVLRIASSFSDVDEVRVFDLKGRLVMDAVFESNLIEIDVSQLSSGTYVLEGLSGGKMWRKDFVVQ